MNLKLQLGSHPGIEANMLDCNIVVLEFKLQSCYYIHFKTNILGKRMNSLTFPSIMGTTAVLL